jgi:hypothetical protein
MTRVRAWASQGAGEDDEYLDWFLCLNKLPKEKRP